MASITLDKLAHSYYPNPKTDADFALKEIDYEWEDGGAYALLGPSGCGKTTLLNIISGLLVPSKGHIKFDGKDVTHLQPEDRNIAQVFQFPVIYDTMTVRRESGLSADQPPGSPGRNCETRCRDDRDSRPRRQGRPQGTRPDR